MTTKEIFTAQKMKFSIIYFFSKLRIWSHLLQKSSVENLIFCALINAHSIFSWRTKHGQLSKHKAMVTYQKLIFLCMMLKKGQTTFRNLIAWNTARFLKYNWPFFNVIPKRELLVPSKGRPSIKKANRHKNANYRGNKSNTVSITHISFFFLHFLFDRTLSPKFSPKRIY